MKKRLKTDGSLDELIEEKSGQYRFTCLTHSHLLSQPFSSSGDCIIGYIYQFVKTSGEFGIIFPFEIVPLPYKILRPCSKSSVNISIDQAQILQEFQLKLWRDVMITPSIKSKENTLTNYYIVPLRKYEIDWTLIQTALEDEDMIQEMSVGNVVQSYYKNQALWMVLAIYDIEKTQTDDFITTLFGKDFPQLKLHINKYGSIPLQDFILTNPLKVSSLDSFNKLHNSTLKPLHKDSTVLFVKPLRDIRCKHKSSRDLQIYPKGTPILPIQHLRVFYLNSSSIKNLSKVYLTLHKIEEYSYFLDFCMNYDFKADAFYLIKQACTGPVKNQKTNYESLETLGDTVLKFVTSLHYFVNNSLDNEGKLTWRRTNVVKNINLTDVSIIKRLFVYLKVTKIPKSKVKPAHLNVDYKDFGNQIMHKFSGRMMADHVEALIGVFYLAKGVKGAIDFLHRLDLIQMSDTWMRYLETTPLDEIHSNLMEGLVDPILNQTLLTDQLFPIPKVCDTSELSDQLNLLSLPLDYKFKDVSFLEEALTHKSFQAKKSYDRLEFLGDALLDLIIMDSIFCLQHKYTPEELTLITDILVNKYQFAKCGVVLELYRYLKCCKSVQDSLDEYLLSLNWKEDIFDFGVYNEDPPKEMSDLFESLIAAVFLDSKDLNLTSSIVMEILAKPILYLVKNRHKLKANIFSDLAILSHRKRKTTRFEYQTLQDLTQVSIYDENNALISQAVHKTKICAKVQATRDAIKALT